MRRRLPPHMRRHGEPAAAAARPDIGVAPVARRRRIARAGMDDGEVAEEAHADVVSGEASDRHRTGGLRQKLPLVDERAVGVRAEKIRGEDLVEAPDIAVLHRPYVVVVERGQRGEVGSALSERMPASIGRRVRPRRID